MITLDRTGALATHLDRWRRTVVRPTAPERVQQIADQLLNNMLFGANVLRRGERARALEILGMIHRGLLWMARAATQQTQHWPTPSKALERELPPELYQRFIGCTAGLMDDALEQAYQESWRWGVELIDALVTSSGIARRAQLIAALDRTIAVSR
jgi:lincosamide nucleotidyltransferase